MMATATTIEGMHATLAAVVPLGLTVALGGPYIAFLKRRMMGQYIREDGPQSHQGKKGTPTAGGVLIIGSFMAAVAVLAWISGGGILSLNVLLVLGVTLAFGLLGFCDDWLKITKKHNKGVSAYTKLAVQLAAGLIVGVLMMQARPAGPLDVLGWHIHVGWLYPVFAIFVIMGASNAVNLTDGLDGLAGSTALIAFMATGMLLAAGGHGDLALLCHAMVGACLGFLVFNHHPARIFMGDTGSLALGGALGTIAIVGGLDVWLGLLGAIFVAEALSVILQVLSFKTTGKRIFRMSPLHHHFELGGWHETRVVFAFVTFELLCCLLALWLYRAAVQ